MSEELSQKGYTRNGEPFGEYEYYNIGSTTINALKRYRIIPDKDYGKYGRSKPDGIIVDRCNLSNIKVIAVIEHKSSEEFNSQDKKDKAAEQCNTYCQVLDAMVGIVTDTSEYLWINPLAAKENSDRTYVDDHGTERSFSYILNEDGYKLSHTFVHDTSNITEVGKVLKLFGKIKYDLNSSNSQLVQEKKIDPKNLSKNVWQSIWLASGENPDKCLATFVEIFIFKYLSDLGVLRENRGISVNFDAVLNSGKNICLEYYYNHVREYVRDLFPASEEDNTSIINGFILDPNIQEHNVLFYNILKSFSDFLTDEDGNERKLVNIEPEFKSRLYEDFLKRSISQKNWGQYFTPRNIVKAMIEISGIENLREGDIVGDSASGVGGFLLEPLLSKRTADYYFDNQTNELKSKLIYEGYDRDPKVIIMAKANMLIYLSELLREHHNLTPQFAQKLNKTFKSKHTSILGSLSVTKPNHYNLIMSNPPYVTKGITNYKEAIKNNGLLKDFYKVNGMGVESLFIEKQIKELKAGGKLLVVIPDGLLNRVNDCKIREYIRKTCIINGIISLPIGAFYSTQKKTYILSATKKENEDIIQTEPVFSYLVSDIGESLDVYRVPTEENDLKDMVKQYKYFMTDKENYQPISKRCKIFDIEKFNPKSNWCIDRWWSDEEKIDLGINPEVNVVNIEDYKEQTEQIMGEVAGLISKLGEIDKETSAIESNFIEERVETIFDIKQGDAFYTLKRIKENGWEGDVPVYSSNTKNNGILTYIQEDKIKEKDKYYDYSLTWSIDGMAGKLFLRNEENKENEKSDEYLFTLNNHCGVLIPKQKLVFYLEWMHKDIYYSYALENVCDELINAVDAIEEADKNKIVKVFNKLLGQETSSDNVVELISQLKQKWEAKLTYDDYLALKKEALPIVLKYHSNRINVDLRFIMYNIQPVFFQKTRSYGNQKLGNNQIEDVKISLPVTVEGAFDYDSMIKLSKEQEKLLEIKEEIVQKYALMKELDVIFE